MAIYHFASLSTTSFYLIWKIEECLSLLYQQLHPLFKVGLPEGKQRSRLLQSVAVRVALFYLLEKLHFPIVPLYKNPQGKPYLALDGLSISMAHTHDLAIAALSIGKPIGIDIEAVTPKLQRIKHRFLSKEEIDTEYNDLERLTICWCAKEALYKYLDDQQSFAFNHISIEPFLLHQQGKIRVHFYQQVYTMHYSRIGNGFTLPLHFGVYCV